MHHIVIFFLFLGLFNAHAVLGKDASPYPKKIQDIHLQEILRDIETLSHPEFQGRQAGTIGGYASARFVAKRFNTLGLRPTNSLVNNGFKVPP